jgi:DegV family protein with EDD domain
MRIYFNGHDFREGVDIRFDEIYKHMKSGHEVPRTSLPHLTDISEMFHQLRREGYSHVLALHLSGAISGTAQAVAAISGDFPDLAVEVIDTKMVAFGLGVMTVWAAREREKMTPFAQIARLLRARRQEMNIYFALNTFEYLKRGGRISAAAASVGDILQVKPVIWVNHDGRLLSREVCRGRKRSLRRLCGIMAEHAGKIAQSGRKIYIGVVHGAALDEADRLAAFARSLTDVEEVNCMKLGPVLGVHTGPGLVGFGVMPFYGPVYGTDQLIKK